MNWSIQATVSLARFPKVLPAAWNMSSSAPVAPMAISSARKPPARSWPGLRYGEGTLYTKNAGLHQSYWQGPSMGWDFGGEGARTMMLVYNLRNVSDMYRYYGGVNGSAYVVGGFGVSFFANSPVMVAPIQSGVGARLGVNAGYLKFTRRPTWNPF
jgi:hypothetical protein